MRHLMEPDPDAPDPPITALLWLVVIFLSVLDYGLLLTR